jgi:hypothetical protein
MLRPGINVWYFFVRVKFRNEMFGVFCLHWVSHENLDVWTQHNFKLYLIFTVFNFI